LNDRVESAFNDQINEEFFSSYIYLAMSAHFEQLNFPGFANWMRQQAQEEVTHAMRLFTHLTRRGGRVVLKAIGEPPVDYGSPLEAFQAALAHEEHITGTIHALYEVALAEKDYPAQLELQWFIDEQVEEEENAGGIVEALKMAGDNQSALLMLDRELAGRTSEGEE
jgi:ferritin